MSIVGGAVVHLTHDTRIDHQMKEKGHNLSRFSVNSFTEWMRCGPTLSITAALMAAARDIGYPEHDT